MKKHLFTYALMTSLALGTYAPQVLALQENKPHRGG